METRRRFDREFRDGAVRIVRETGKPIAVVARDLGINEGTLGNLVAGDRRARGDGVGALDADERAELDRRTRGRTSLPRMARDAPQTQRSAKRSLHGFRGLTVRDSRGGSMIPSAEVRKAFSKDEAAQLYGVSLQTINRAIHAGRLRAKKVGRYYRISAEALAEWFEGWEDG